MPRVKRSYTQSACELSDDQLHRFVLMRSWAHEDRFAPYRALIYLMLNPSTADGTKDDPTIRSCVRIANYHGYGHILVGNLWSYRATDWKMIRDIARAYADADCGRPDPMAANVPESDEWLTKMLLVPGTVLGCGYVRADVCLAWGSHVLDIPGAARRISDLMHLYRSSPLSKQPPFCLGVTKSGNPNHPLFMAEATQLVPWTNEQEVLRNAA